MISWSCDAACEELDRGDEDPCGSRCDGLLEVLCEAAVPIEPSQCAFDDPASGQDDKPLFGIGAFDDLDGPFADPPEGVPELVASISTIGEDMAQPREALDDLGQHQRRTVTVLDVGGVDYRMDEIAVGVGQDVALAALGLFARIIAPRSAAFRGFDALAVDYPGAGRGFATGPLTGDQQQSMI